MSGTYEESGNIEVEQGVYGYSEPVTLYQEESYVETEEDSQEEDVTEISGQLGYPARQLPRMLHQYASLCISCLFYHYVQQMLF